MSISCALPFVHTARRVEMGTSDCGRHVVKCSASCRGRGGAWAAAGSTSKVCVDKSPDHLLGGRAGGGQRRWDAGSARQPHERLRGGDAQAMRRAKRRGWGLAVRNLTTESRGADVNERQ
jgi:hypothetical protein